MALQGNQGGAAQLLCVCIPIDHNAVCSSFFKRSD